ncbi:MAG: TRAP transporter large permease [Patescibacteria group bacterium]|nr:TRAP transporter large permease [Patescibacteria group bacterium]
MTTEVLVLAIAFFSLLLLNVPIAICLGAATVLAILAVGNLPAGYLVAQRMSTGIGSFPLLAIPFFIFSGILMGESGMAQRLMDFASALMARFRGGLAYVNTLTCMMFGALSGSATAAVSSIGGFMIPQMERRGYGRPFSVALTSTSATTGLLIPPSNIMIVYAVVAGDVSVAALFLAGVIPGVLVGLLIMAVCLLANLKDGVAPEPGASVREVARTFFSALPSLLLIVIVLGGILGGIFSATEASAVAAAYAFILGVFVYRKIPLARIPAILLRSSQTTAVVMFLIGMSQAMSWFLAYESVPQSLSAGLLAISDNPLVVLLLINVLLLVVGALMDMTPAVLIFTPIFLPVVVGLGYSPVHFGIMLIANLCIGLCTPPVGTCLFVGCSVGQLPISRVIRPMLPLLGAMVIALFLITYCPELSLWLPRMAGL